MATSRTRKTWGNGNDAIEVGLWLGFDEYDGGSGGDILSGTSGNDRLYGGDGNDSLMVVLGRIDRIPTPPNCMGRPGTTS